MLEKWRELPRGRFSTMARALTAGARSTFPAGCVDHRGKSRPEPCAATAGAADRRRNHQVDLHRVAGPGSGLDREREASRPQGFGEERLVVEDVGIQREVAVRGERRHLEVACTDAVVDRLRADEDQDFAQVRLDAADRRALAELPVKPGDHALPSGCGVVRVVPVEIWNGTRTKVERVIG